jgi:hypothetical protein
MEQELLYGRWKSYTDLFSYIYVHRLFLNEWFNVPGTEQRILIADIKAKAFDEVYPYLPTKGEMEFIIDKMEDINSMHLIEILRELPAK